MNRLALLGSPVDGALSPVLHRAAYAAMGLAWNSSCPLFRRTQLTPSHRSDRVALERSWMSSTVRGQTVSLRLPRKPDGVSWEGYRC